LMLLNPATPDSLKALYTSTFRASYKML
jgi:hypothetical protein